MRECVGKVLITYWEKMKQWNFLPLNYMQSLFQCCSPCFNVSNVYEKETRVLMNVTEKFRDLVIWIDIMESEIGWFLSLLLTCSSRINELCLFIL